jgi:hypothetical protein
MVAWLVQEHLAINRGEIDGISIGRMDRGNPVEKYLPWGTNRI